jgi:hypothetical protein
VKQDAELQHYEHKNVWSEANFPITYSYFKLAKFNSSSRLTLLQSSLAVTTSVASAVEEFIYLKTQRTPYFGTAVPKYAR